MIRSSILLAALLIGLTGCSTTPEAGQPRPTRVEEEPSTSAAAPSGRAKVTAGDYEAAVGRLAACLKESRIELLNDGWDPVDNERIILRYKAPGMDYEQVSKVAGRCESMYLTDVAARYTQDNKSHMAPELMAAVRACLKAREIELSGREQNPDDLLNAVPPNRHDELRACVRNSVRVLYPNLLSTSFP
jgi:hypothetical protein